MLLHSNLNDQTVLQTSTGYVHNFVNRCHLEVSQYLVDGFEVEKEVTDFNQSDANYPRFASTNKMANVSSSCPEVV